MAPRCCQHLYSLVSSLLSSTTVQSRLAIVVMGPENRSSSRTLTDLRAASLSQRCPAVQGTGMPVARSGGTRKVRIHLMQAATTLYLAYSCYRTETYTCAPIFADRIISQPHPSPESRQNHLAAGRRVDLNFVAPDRFPIPAERDGMHQETEDTSPGAQAQNRCRHNVVACGPFHCEATHTSSGKKIVR